MTKYRMKSIEVEATQWWRNGDHPEDGPLDSEGEVVRYFNRPDIPGDSPCLKCNWPMRVHGWIDTPGEGLTVCPGDWVVTGAKGQRCLVKPHTFAEMYESTDRDS